MAKRRKSQIVMLDHSKAKVELLRKYLEKYLNIIANNGFTKRIDIFDLFCGEGMYEKGGSGSPIEILNALRELHLNNEVLLFLPTQFMYRFDEKGTPQALIEILEELVDLNEWRVNGSVHGFIHQFKEALRKYLGNDFFVDTFTIQKDATKIKFLSCEPLIGPLMSINLDNIDWVIVGGESGRKARPIKEWWVWDIRQQCQEAGVAFFFKQWGV